MAAPPRVKRSRLVVYVLNQIKGIMAKKEGATAQGIVDKLKKCNDYAGILYLNDKLGTRE